MLRAFGLLLTTIGLIGFALHLQASARPLGKLQLELRDSRTGMANVGHVQLRNLEDGRLSSFQTSKEGTLVAEVEPGRYMVSAFAAGQSPGHASSVVNFGETSSLRFHLDPVNLPYVLQPERVRSLRRDGFMLVQGFVSFPNGEPAAGADVTCATEKTQADSTGYFELLASVKTPSVDLEVGHPTTGRLMHKNLETWSGGDVAVRERLPAVGETTTIDEANFRRRSITKEEKGEDCSDCKQEEVYENPGDVVGEDFADAPALPASIRVGRNCPTATTCTTVEVYSVDRYVKGVVPSEWYSCWGNVTGGLNCLKSGSVSVRSYGVYHVYNPRTSTYDICDTTSCQVFGNTTTSNTDTAADQTTRWVLLTATGDIARSEYSAENNNAGCGDGFSGTGSTSAPCINDGVCTGFATFGHGRGLCQWGSARWATGKRLSSSQACTTAAPNHGLGTKDWQQILTHYHPLYTLQQGVSPSLLSMTYGSTALRGTLHPLTFNVTSQAARSGVLLGASLQSVGGGTVYSDAPNDVVISLVPGTNPYGRSFSVSSGIPAGSYDVLGALYFDRNGSGTINAGDFVMSSRVQVNSLSVQIGTSVTTAARRMIKANRASALTATLRQVPGNTGISARTITFKLNGSNIGTAVTNPLGVATLNWTPPVGTPAGPNTLSIEFAAVSGYQAASASGELLVFANP